MTFSDTYWLLLDCGFTEEQAETLISAGYLVTGWCPVVEPLAVAL